MSDDMSMRERIARAFAPEAWADERPTMHESCELAKITALHLADNILAAMEEPTPAMHKAWEPLHPQWSQWEAPPRLVYPLLSGPAYAWKIGIRAARDGK